MSRLYLSRLGHNVNGVVDEDEDMAGTRTRSTEEDEDEDEDTVGTRTRSTEEDEDEDEDEDMAGTRTRSTEEDEDEDEDEGEMSSVVTQWGLIVSLLLLHRCWESCPRFFPVQSTSF